MGIIDVGGTLDLVGSDRGFTVSAFTDEINAFVGPFGCRPCLPGDPISVNVVAGGLSIVGHATLDGKTYGLGGVESPGNLDLFFSGPHLFAPPLNVAPIVALTSSLDFSGVFIHVDDPSQPTLTESLVSEGLGATATVTVEIRRLEGHCGPSAEGCWNISSATYELTSTPEPRAVPKTLSHARVLSTRQAVGVEAA